jgi:hypothetical protein
MRSMIRGSAAAANLSCTAVAHWTASTTEGKLHQRAIAHELDDTAAMARNFRIKDIPAMGFHGLERARLVFRHEPGVANNIGGQYRSKSASHPFSPRGRD